MLLFALISVLNLALGFAAAVALGYGPRPWWGIFAEAGTTGTVRIEKLEDEPAPPTDESNEAEPEEDDEEDHLDDEDDSEPGDDLDEEPEEDDEALTKAKLAKLQEINANKLAKRLEEEQRRAPTKNAKDKAKSPPAAEIANAPEAVDEEEAAEEDSFSVSSIIDDDDLSSMIGEAADEEEVIVPDDMEELLGASESHFADDDIDESLDEIESLLKAAGQLESDIAAAAEEDLETEEDPVMEVAEQDESEPADIELTADEIEAMFKLQ
ncbi:hypothetical protein LOC68_13985 [Blastopirellula sp. JC732]|uniref:Uncharacterized protein n=1 Tax=Blastopirellula sediminis TaxID=2894196 RepID=A0A9X1MMR1_9BACT|nr:hypothetical protein [Blastopirellula sediminis]MCC9607208.1 hypothetical protein [Blastopirellula sediminis]MCC9629499.1 hypothetical protein [Blastopirellula sediminis]